MTITRSDLDDVYGVVRDLRIEIAELRAQLDQYRHRMATEVRTRRIVVVDDRGRDLIATDCGEDWTQLTVNHWPEDSTGDGDGLAVCLFAGSETNAGEARIYLRGSEYGPDGDPNTAGMTWVDVGIVDRYPLVVK